MLKKKYNFIVNEEDVTNIIKALNKSRNIWNFKPSIGNCGWQDKSKWYIVVKMSDNEMNRFYLAIKHYYSIELRYDNLIERHYIVSV